MRKSSRAGRLSAEEKAAIAIWKKLREEPGIVVIALACGLTRQAVQQWKMVPLAHIIAVSKQTGRSRSELRPDIAAIWESGCAAAE